MILLFMLCNLVVLREDSLLFMNENKIVDVWLLEYSEPRTINGVVHHQQVKISDDGRFFFIYYSRQDTTWNYLRTELSFYNVNKKMLFNEKRELDRMINFELSDIDNNNLIYVDCIANAEDPQMYVRKGGKTIIPIKKGEWKRIVSYDLSDNNKYLIVHVRNPYMNKLWDYIYFYDLKTGKTWQYLFPLCLSCKRTRINVAVDVKGQSDIEYKGEHRIFSKDGNLIDYYIEK